MSNVLNRIAQPVDSTQTDNAVTFAGTVTLSGTVAMSGANTITGATTYDATAFTAEKIANVLRAHDVEVFAAGTALNTSGINLVTGGTGIADFTLAAPEPGCLCTIRIDSLSSGNVVVTTATGVTFDGTNNTATFNAAEDALELAYVSATQWNVASNIGSVVFSSV